MYTRSSFQQYHFNSQRTTKLSKVISVKILTVRNNKRKHPFMTIKNEKNFLVNEIVNLYGDLLFT